MSLRSQARRALLRLSYHTRAPRVWDLLHPGRVKVLMYHGITTKDRFPGVANYWGYNVPVREFAEQVRYLARHCHPISLRDLLIGRGLSRSRLNVVLTFDDGYRNNCTNAFPVLQQFRVPAVFAVATSFVRDKKPLWNDVVEDAVNRTRRPAVVIDWQGERRAFSLADAAGRLDLYNWLMYQCVVVEQTERDAFLDHALAALEVSATGAELYRDDDYRPLEEQQIREMSRSELAEFASHSVQHLLLAKVSRENKRAELVESKREIERMTGVPCTAFCVPGGSYDSVLLEEAFGAGYECVLTSDTGTARAGERVLNRNGVFRHDLPEFVDEVHGPVGPAVRKARRAKQVLGKALRGGRSR
jgi:peptidoglycan/xylan/chitin deacetylase (PgdA/CDA1 family)